ncbi:MAG: acyltransferase, partial [Deltaproteobacteria bacterium]|nr:acyltransferase [Deltaproteobacteria bacterium]
TYLNLLRFFSAAAVVLHHFHDKHFGPDWLTRYFPSEGRGFVTVFFVLSGFVVSMVAAQKSVGEFALDRSVRIYVVALPILVGCTLLSIWFPYAFATTEYQAAVDQPLATFVLNALFLSQSWQLYSVPFLDGPYWSLSYEVMYYVIFACFTYAQGKLRWLWVALSLLVAGPKVLLLFPCWLMGALAYKYRNANQHGWAWALAAPLILVVAFKVGLKEVANELSDNLSRVLNLPPDGFIRSWLVALGVAFHIWGVCSIKQKFGRAVSRWGGRLAGMSYTLYLVHLPTLYILAAWIGDHQTLKFLILAMPVTLLTSYLVSLATEAQRGRIKDLVRAALASVANAERRRAASGGGLGSKVQQTLERRPR